MSEHTSWEWKPRLFNPPGRSRNWHAIQGPDGQIIAVLLAEHYDDLEELTANTHLITAAPDLLEACKEAQKFAEEMQYSERSSVHKWAGRVQKKVKRAIAKAKGEES